MLMKTKKKIVEIENWKKEKKKKRKKEKKKRAIDMDR